MAITAPDVTALSVFTGRSEPSFSPYAVQALDQATLLFSIATGLVSLPTDPTYKQLALNGIMALADSLYLAQPHAETASSPFQSETLGVYSYTRATQKVMAAENTGVLWFDLAVNQLRAVSPWDVAITGSGTSVFEWDENVRYVNGHRKVIGPKDRWRYGMDDFSYQHDPSQGRYVSASGGVDWDYGYDWAGGPGGDGAFGGDFGSGNPHDGATGATGPTGYQFVFYQHNPLAVWVIHHNLNGFPNVTVVDETGEEIMPDVEYVDNNTVRVVATWPFSGAAYFS
jgi:hypothetical protein